ncbi:ABC transporter ATP-binding protein [Spiribacter halobius]|uniref:ABC transporter ATP-binding protein n=1 Tax=Sediminicurvatus halobius TaxID=2182432 RepID=A0A2U2MYD9_9GAMM|nr:ABC transporter ATP-binding protein [Spiribacter halobius]PWG61813.1 ABC transporter ATP-binding protein [Spiribacter halobius]UEX77653.1 ABC transporter ATP-binding protein [Spiribacter halobius]
MNTCFVDIESVTKRFGTTAVVDDISLGIENGEFLAIMGSSGCGKTTLLRMIAGLETPSAGSIRIAGKPMNGVSACDREAPLVWQSLALFPFLTVVENVEFGLRMRGVAKAERRRRALQWLERMEIAHLAERGIEQLSGGQKQRVALARALVTEPPMLLLDEPFSALDASLTVRMQGVISRLQRELGITFILVTHSHSEAFALADRVVIMNEGRIEQIGRPREVYERPRSRFVAEFLGANNIFSGTVRRVEDEVVTVETADGVFDVTRASELNPQTGSNVDLIVSADQMELAMEGDGVACRLVGEEFIGANVNLHLETPAGTTLVVQTPRQALDALSPQVGDEYVARWQSSNAHLVAAA